MTEKLYVAKNYQETLRLIRKSKEKKLSLPSKTDRFNFLKKEVYGESNPHDVAEHYFQKINEIVGETRSG